MRSPASAKRSCRNWRGSAAVPARVQAPPSPPSASRCSTASSVPPRKATSPTGRWSMAGITGAIRVIRRCAPSASGSATAISGRSVTPRYPTSSAMTRCNASRVVRPRRWIFIFTTIRARSPSRCATSMASPIRRCRRHSAIAKRSTPAPGPVARPYSGPTAR
jgi:hypothetical protein